MATTASAHLSAPGAIRLVGRTRELAALDRLLGARAPAAGVLALSGEPGIGKTRLLGELCARADARGLLVLEGRASELERDVPFALAIDALDDYLTALPPARLERLGQSRLAELAVVFPALAELRDAGRGLLGGERYRLHAAVRALLEALSEPRAVLLALDDVHWADDASLELVAHLLRRRPRGVLALALAYRSHRAPELLNAALAAAAREGACERIELAPLSREAAGELVGAAPAPVRAALVRDSGANPFYLEQLVRARRSETWAAAVGPDGGQAPAAVRAALAAELARLPAAARALLDAAAVAGDPFDVDLAAEIAPLPAAAALDELTAYAVIRPTDAPRRFRFRHPIVRRAVYEAAAPGRRLAIHARAAAALQARGAPSLARAHHLERAARPGDEQARITLTVAADEAAGRAPATAARWYLAALRLLPPTASDEQRRALLVALQRRTAEVLIAEIGADMTVFPSARHPASWAGQCPGNDRSAGKQRSGRTRKGSRWLNAALKDAAMAAIRTNNSYLRALYERQRSRIGHGKAIGAVKHSIIVAAWHMLTTGELYDGLGPDYYRRRDPARTTKRLVAQLEALGHSVTLQEAAA